MGTKTELGLTTQYSDDKKICLISPSGRFNPRAARLLKAGGSVLGGEQRASVVQGEGEDVKVKL